MVEGEAVGRVAYGDSKSSKPAVRLGVRNDFNFADPSLRKRAGVVDSVGAGDGNAGVVVGVVADVVADVDGVLAMAFTRIHA